MAKDNLSFIRKTDFLCENLNRNIGNPITMYNGNIVHTISLEAIVKRDRCWSGKILKI